MYEKSLDPEMMKNTRARWQRMLQRKNFQIRKEMVDGLMPGSIDIHIHAWPCAYVARQFSEIEIGRRATDAGMRAVVFKCHSTPSSGRTPLVQEAVDEYAGRVEKTASQIIGGVALNYCVGGINPHAAEASANFGGRYVWLPSVHASHCFRVQSREGGIPVLDDRKQLLPEVRDVLKIIAERDMILGLAHQSTEERFLIAQEAKELGVKWMSASHPQGGINEMTVEQMKEMAELGVYICIQNQTIYSHALNDETLEMIKQVRGDRLVYGSDLTMWGGVHPVDGVRLLIEVLLGYGVPEETVRNILIDNPKRLLFG
jgi:hypothetical protein